MRPTNFRIVGEFLLTPIPPDDARFLRYPERSFWLAGPAGVTPVDPGMAQEELERRVRGLGSRVEGLDEAVQEIARIIREAEEAGWVIRYPDEDPDNQYDQGSGNPVPLADADFYPDREEAERVLSLVVGGELVDARRTPFGVSIAK